METPDPEGDRRQVDDLDSRLSGHGKTQKPQHNGGQSSGMSHRQTDVAYRVLVDMIAGLLVGGFLGYWLDRWLGWAPFAWWLLSFVEFVAGANNAWRAIRRFRRRGRKATTRACACPEGVCGVGGSGD